MKSTIPPTTAFIIAGGWLVLAAMAAFTTRDPLFVVGSVLLAAGLVVSGIRSRRSERNSRL